MRARKDSGLSFEGISVTRHLSKRYWQAVSLRYDLLREPLNLHFTREQLLAEDKDIHIIYRKEGAICGCLVLTPLTPDRIKMRQVAVDEALQGQGIGKNMVGYAESYAYKLGYKIMECNARWNAIPFYESQGYQRVGEPFEEVTIRHSKMEKELS